MEKDFEEIREKIKHFTKAQNSIKFELDSLYKERDSILLKRLEKLVGICFKQNNQLYIVSGVPQPVLTMVSSRLNPYQIPVLVLTKDCEFVEDTVFSNACDYKDSVSYFLKDKEQITREELVVEITKKIEERIGSIGNS